VIETRVNEFRSKPKDFEGSKFERAQLEREIDDLKTSFGRITRELDAARYKRIEERELEWADRTSPRSEDSAGGSVPREGREPPALVR